MIKLTQKQKISIYQQAKTDPALALLQSISIIVEQANQIVAEKVKEATKDIKGDKGDAGEQGPKPVKGEDYFTDEEIEEFAVSVLELAKPKKGKDYFTTEEVAGFIEIIKKHIPAPIKGEKGKDGKTPRAGIDYPTKQEIAKMIAVEFKDMWGAKNKDIEKTARKVLQELFETKNAKKIARVLEALQGNDRLDHSALKNSPDLPTVKLYDEKRRAKRLGRGTGSAVKVYDLSSQLDGVLKTFTIPNNLRVLAVHMSSFPFSSARPTTDYTTTSTTITFTSEIDASTQLAAGQSLLVEYVEA